MEAVVAAIALGIVTPGWAQSNQRGGLLLGLAGSALLFGLLERKAGRQALVPARVR